MGAPQSAPYAQASSHPLPAESPWCGSITRGLLAGRSPAGLGPPLTRLWAVLPRQDWQPPPPEGLEGSGALKPVLTPSAEPSGPFRQLHQPALEGLQIGQHLGQQIQHQSPPPLHMLGIEIVGIKLAHPMMKAQPFAQPTRGSGADQRQVMARGAPGFLVCGCTTCTNQGELWEKSRSARPARTSLR